MFLLIVKSLRNITLGVIIGIPLILYPLLYFFQDGMIFVRQNMDIALFEQIKMDYPNAAITIKTADDKTLQAWYFKNNSQSPAPLIIYFGGNAEEVSTHFTDLKYFTDWSLLLVNYRGYGLSEGKPSEKVLFNDALLIYDKFATRNDINDQKIVAFGRSLGTGVAIHLAAHRKLAGIILISPYDSVASIAQGVYPYVPISLLLNHPFRVINYANKIQIPMLALIAKNDRIIPPHHSFKLIDAWGGKVYKKVIENTNHNNIGNETEVWQQISQFLKLH